MHALNSLKKRNKSFEDSSNSSTGDLSVRSLDLYNYAYEEKKQERVEQTKLSVVKDLY